MEKSIGRGGLRLLSANGLESRFVTFEITSNGINFFPVSHATFFGNDAHAAGAHSLFEAAGVLGTSFSGTGYLMLDGLPASPDPDFFDVSITVRQVDAQSEDFDLTVQHPNVFGTSMHGHFSQLNVTFQQRTAEGLRITAGSSLLLHALGQDIPLQAELSAAKGLYFSASGGEVIAIDDIGSFKAEGDLVTAPIDRWSHVQAAYAFSEQQGLQAYDMSHSGAPLILQAIEVPGNSGHGNGRGNNRGNASKFEGPTWVPGGLALNEAYFMRSIEDASDIISSLKQSGEFTVETWIKAQSGAQEAPAQIFALQGKGNKNWFTLAQGGKGADNSFLTVDVQFDRPGKDLDNAVHTPAGSLPGSLAHVVFTHDSAGREKVYVNGKLVAQRINTGGFGEWDEDLEILIGHPGKNYPKTGPWSGEIHHLALYDTALSDQDIFRHYVPQFELSGAFSLNQVPAPLAGVPFAGSIQFRRNSSILGAGGATSLEIRPSLDLLSGHFQLSRVEEAAWSFSGNMDVGIWQSQLPFSASFGADGTFQLEAADDTPHALQLQGLGSIDFHGIRLRAVESGPQSDWMLSSKPQTPFSAIPALLPVQVAIDSDFKLLWPVLGLDADDNVIHGHWLSQELVLHTREGAGHLLLEGSSSFSIPFSYDLPALIDPETGAQLSEAVQIRNEQMQVELDITLQPTGFLAVRRAHFGYTDSQGAAQTIVFPEKRMYLPPASQNALLGELLDELTANAAGLFAGQGRNVADYFLVNGAEQPQIFLGKDAVESPTIQTQLPAILKTDAVVADGNDIFRLTQTGSQSQLVISAKGKAANELRAAYDEFMVQVAGAQPASAGAVQVLKRRIAERIPAPVTDMLYYYYGWDTTAGTVDLQGGMRLRIDLQNYQFVQASDPSAKRGFVGSGSFYLDVNSYTYPQNNGTFSQLLGFGPFLSQLQVNGNTDITNEGAGSVFDLLKNGNRKAFYRLFYPSQPSTGLGPERVVTIIGTDTLAEMQQVTRDFNPDGNVVPATGTSFFFRGKAIVVPEIQVFVQREAVYVPLGTTLRQLAEQFDEVPSAGLAGQDLRAYAGSNRPLRLVHEGPDSQASYRFVNLEQAAAVNGLDALDLPLVKGDRIYL